MRDMRIEESASTGKKPATTKSRLALSVRQKVTRYVTEVLQALTKSRTARVETTEEQKARLSKLGLDRISGSMVDGRRAVVYAHSGEANRADFSVVIEDVALFSGATSIDGDLFEAGLSDTLRFDVMYVSASDDAAFLHAPRLRTAKFSGAGLAVYVIELTLDREPPKSNSKVAADVLALMRDPRSGLPALIASDLVVQMAQQARLRREYNRRLKIFREGNERHFNAIPDSPSEAVDKLGPKALSSPAVIAKVNPMGDEDPEQSVFNRNLSRLVAVLTGVVREQAELQLVKYLHGPGAAKAPAKKKTTKKGGAAEKKKVSPRTAVSFAAFKTFATRQLGPNGVMPPVSMTKGDNAIEEVGVKRLRSIFEPNPRVLVKWIVSSVNGQGARSVFGGRIKDPAFVKRLYAKIEFLYPLIIFQVLQDLLDEKSGLALTSNPGFDLPRSASATCAKLLDGLRKDAEAKRVVNAVLRGTAAPLGGVAATKKVRGVKPVPEEPEDKALRFAAGREALKGRLALQKTARAQQARQAKAVIAKTEKIAQAVRVEEMKQKNQENLAKANAARAANRTRKLAEKEAAEARKAEMAKVAAANAQRGRDIANENRLRKKAGKPPLTAAEKAKLFPKPSLFGRDTFKPEPLKAEPPEATKAMFDSPDWGVVPGGPPTPKEPGTNPQTKPFVVKNDGTPPAAVRAGTHGVTPGRGTAAFIKGHAKPNLRRDISDTDFVSRLKKLAEPGGGLYSDLFGTGLNNPSTSGIVSVVQMFNAYTQRYAVEHSAMSLPVFASRIATLLVKGQLTGVTLSERERGVVRAMSSADLAKVSVVDGAGRKLADAIQIRQPMMSNTTIVNSVLEVVRKLAAASEGAILVDDVVRIGAPGIDQMSARLAIMRMLDSGVLQDMDDGRILPSEDVMPPSVVDYDLSGPPDAAVPSTRPA